MASAIRLDDETEDHFDFEMLLDDLSDPVQSVEPPQMTSHVAAGEERGSAGLRMRNEEGLTPGGYRYRNRSRTSSFGCGRPRSSGSELRGRKTSAISESGAADGERTAKSTARPRGRSIAISILYRMSKIRISQYWKNI